MNERVNSAVKALISDESLLAKFQDSPSDAMRKFELLECELEAVKLGDEQSLLAHGMDPALMGGKVVAPHWFNGLFGTVARRMAAPAVLAILLALGVHAADTQTASAARANFRAGSRVRNVRTFGPSGLHNISARARTRTQVRTVRARIRTRASARAGLSQAASQLGVCKCFVSPGDGSDGTP
ncbi:hypothetical protein JYU04_01780 [Dehalococcoides mccartyi]|nr:hypothetical protein [Dehalococcoides mccartyi]